MSKIVQATQEQVDRFMASALFNKDISPYLQTSTYNSHIRVEEGDWNSIIFTTENVDFLLIVYILRDRENSLDISLWANSSYWAGKAISIIPDLIKRYNPLYIETTVHESNVRSLKINERLMGPPWGIEPKGAWNTATGKWEGKVKFKKILKD